MLTDADILSAAKKRLAEHLAMRPITPAEASAKAMELEFRGGLARIDAETSEGLRAQMQRELADSYHQSAKYYRDLASMPEGEAYAATTAHLQARVAFYQNRVISGFPCPGSRTNIGTWQPTTPRSRS